MELERRRQRQRQREDRKEATGARSIHDLPDDMLRRILLRLDSPLWLIRAACACKRWRRAVTDGGGDDGRAFLRLARSLHPPTVVGQYHVHTSGDDRFVPSSSSPIIGGGSRFSVDGFLDKPKQGTRRRWHVADCHGDLVLSISGYDDGSVSNLVVCDPLTRKHRSISGPPTKEEQGFVYLVAKDFFLLDGDDGDISISNFKVLHRRINAGGTDHPQPQVCVFSSTRGYSGEWGWRFLSHRLSDENLLYLRCSLQAAGRDDRSLYLGLPYGSRIRMVAIDNTSLVFSMVDLPTCVDTSLPLRPMSSFTVVVHGSGGLGPTSPQRRTSIVHVCGEELELFRRVHGSGEWVLEHTIANLSEATRGLSASLELKIKKNEEGIAWRTMVSVVADGAAFAILSASSHSYSDQHSCFNQRWFFSIDVNTMELRVLPEETCRGQTTKIINYTLPWPQFLRSCP